ncbi:polysaccharide export outer membrane protein [Roseovarius sp. MBR-154]
MLLKLRALVLAACALSLAACSLPSGAALQSSVVSEGSGQNPSLQVVPVTRSNVSMLSEWPATGWSGRYNWLSASRGPDSALIQTGDTLQMVVWDTQENSLLASSDSRMTTVPPIPVSASGTIFMPYVGEVAVRGLTADAARTKLQESLSDIAPTAQVQLSVEQGRNNAVDMASGVGLPGRYMLESRNTTILSVISEAGGISPALRHPLIVLQRDGRRYETRAEDLLNDPQRDILLRGGDRIAVVEDDRNFNALGAAGQQSVIYFEEESITAMQAVSQMGGLLASRANPKGLLVLRDYTQELREPFAAGPHMEQVVFTLDFTTADGLFAARKFEINPGDTLLATESPVTRVQTILGLLGTVVGFTATANNLTQ